MMHSSKLINEKLKNVFFPYDYFDSYDKLNETELPSHDLFYSKMKNKNISDEEYNICIMLGRITT